MGSSQQIVEALKPIITFAAIAWGISTIAEMILKDIRKSRRGKNRKRRRR